MTQLTCSHQSIASHRPLAVFLTILTFLACGAFVALSIGAKGIVAIPYILAVTAVFLSSLSLWVWVYLAIPLTIINYLAMFAIFDVAYLLPGYVNLSVTAFFVLISLWLILGIPIPCVCMKFFEFGRRAHGHCTHDEGLGDHRDVELGAMRPGATSLRNANYGLDVTAGLTTLLPVYTISL